jgi:TRAP-type C4-dicarboxylate transport system substrate-binding protein
MRLFQKLGLYAAVGAMAFAGSTFTAKSSNAAETWVLGSIVQKTSSTYHAINNIFIPRLESFSGNQIKVEPQILTGLCSEQVCLEQMAQNLIQIATCSTENAGALGTDIELVNLPYVFKDAHWANQIATDWLRDELNVGAEKNMNLHMLTMNGYGGFRQVIQNVKEVRTPADMKGIKIRVTKSPAAFNLFKAWGAVPVPYDWSQLYMGLQANIVNGLYIPTPPLEATKMYEVANKVTLTGGAWTGYGMFLDAKFYRGLKPEIKKAVDMAADAVQRTIFVYDLQWIEAAVASLKAKGTTFYQPTPKELSMWRDGSVAVWQEQGKVGAGIDKVRARRVLAEQGSDDFIQVLEKGGVL